tara:strand:+ start:67 stop:819 length:753 start_codon:yes stop_codon:yes gene_type:complete
MPLENIAKVKALLFDLDGTFVSGDIIESRAYRSLALLHASGIKTIAVTGRPAGWCDLMARWWPINAVVGENGAFFYSKISGKVTRQTFHDISLLPDYQERLQSLFRKLLKKYPYLKLASDQSFRHWDIAVDIAEEANVSREIALDIVRICEAEGAKAAISNIHVNIWFGDYNKENMSLNVLKSYGLTEKEGVYIGDSPNDSPMFGCFPLSVGVSSVLDYQEIMEYLPSYTTDSDGSDGFIELIELISSTR